MAMGAAARQAHTLPTGLNDVLDQLTIAHAENLDRHGPLLGERIEAPADAIAYAVQQQQRAKAIDTATTPAAKSAALLAKEAHQHEQIGRLAYHVAGYELAHGDQSNAPPMRELGRDHLQLAAGLWKDAGEMMDRKQPADDWLAQQDAEILGGKPTSESAGQWDAMIADAKAQPAPYAAPKSADPSELSPIHPGKLADLATREELAAVKAEQPAPYTAPQSADLSDLMPKDAAKAVKTLNDNDRGNPGRGL